jgi:DNA repair exonuclease SbcCD ATPase subunit
MILFKTLRYRNFLSTGNNFTTIDFTRSKTTLVIGHNGAGKSTMLDALSYALFGKPHRNINKPQLINSINNKNCEVEVEFSIGQREYKIIRGIKPGKFEIYVDGTMINQSSHAKEYQKILEQNILKLNHKSFHQIVVLGSSSFIPFMQLPSHHRRDVIEDLLDINVFSKMNQILKEKQSILKDNLKDVNYDLELAKDKIDLQQNYIKEVEGLSTKEIESKEQEISDARSEIEQIQSENVTLSNSIERRSRGLEEKIKKSHDKKQALLQYKAEFDTKIKTLVKEAKFYDKHDNCPTCEQEISKELKKEKVQTAKDKAAIYQDTLKDIAEQATAVEIEITDLTSRSQDIRDKTSTITTNNNSIDSLQNRINSLSKQIEKIRGSEGDTAKAKAELSILKETRESHFENKIRINEDVTYNSVILEMLKDTGIKTKIIKQYLPVINQLTNQYLQILDFFVHFNLDESFTETIRSRHRDNFSYDSFSEGEKQRIDLALLFTWRQVAKMKNSVATNLLILDETFDSSLDHDGVGNLMKIIYAFGEDTNVFVISHKGEILDDKFESKMEFIKDKNFSKVK